MSSFFDIAAINYDDTFTNTKIGWEQRKKVYQNLDFVLNSEKLLDILELNCGTGADAIAFAEKGHNIIATDISQEMIKVANNKNNHDTLQFEVLDCNELSENTFQKQFDLIFSNFGGLNCLSSSELKKLLKTASELLKPKGKLIMVLMPKQCLWERLYFALKGDFKKSKRRNTKEALPVNVDGVQVPTWYYNPKDIELLLENKFKITNCTPVGITVPPSYLETSVLTQFPIWNVLKSLEQHISNTFYAKYADHFLIELTKE